MYWFSEGVVNVVNNSPQVTIVGSTFAENVRNGEAFKGPDGRWYEIINVPTPTTIAIKPNYAGPTANSQPFTVAPVQGYVKVAADALWEAVRAIQDSAEAAEIISGNPVALNFLQQTTQAAQRTALQLGSSATLPATSSASPPSGQVWRTNDLVKQTSGLSTDEGAVLVARASGGAFGLGAEAVLDANGDTFPRTGFFRATTGTTGLEQNYHTIHVQRVANAQSGQFLIRDGGGPANRFAAVRNRGSSGAWSGMQWLHTDKTLPYETGTFEPSVVGDTTSGTATYSTRSGVYTRIGNRVDFSMVFGYSAHTGAGAMLIAGLPFSRIASNAGTVVLNAYSSGLTFSSGTFLTPLVNTDGGITMRASDPNGSIHPVTINSNTDVSQVRIAGTYFIN